MYISAMPPRTETRAVSVLAAVQLPLGPTQIVGRASRPCAELPDVRVWDLRTRWPVDLLPGVYICSQVLSFCRSFSDSGQNSK